MRRAFFVLILAASCGDNNNQRPSVEALSPARGPLGGGTRVAVSGDNLAGARVSVGSNLATDVSLLADGRLEFTTPAGEEPGPIDVIVFNDRGGAVIEEAFSYNPLPTVTRVVPDRGSHLGAPVSLLGTGFADLDPGQTTVRFGDAECANPEVADDTTLNCAAPPGPSWALVDIELENANGVATLADGFGYQRPGLFAAEGRGGIDGMLFFVDPGTADAVAIGPIGVAITGLSAHIDGDLYGVTSNGNGVTAGFPRDLVRIDPFTGAAETIGPLRDGGGVLVKIADIAFSGDTLFGWSRTTDGLVTIDRETGAVSNVGDNSIASQGGGLEVDLSGDIYLAPAGSAGDLLEIDDADGTELSALTMTDGEPDDLNSLADSGDGVGLVAVREGVSSDGVSRATLLIFINLSTGAVTEIGELPFGTDAIARTPPLPFL